MGLIFDINTAMEKQKPKMPTRSDTRLYFICPCCNRFLDRHEQSHGNIDIPYCKWCGQRLDWKAFDSTGKANRINGKEAGR